MLGSTAGIAADRDRLALLDALGEGQIGRSVHPSVFRIAVSMPIFQLFPSWTLVMPR